MRYVMIQIGMRSLLIAKLTPAAMRCTKQSRLMFFDKPNFTPDIKTRSLTTNPGRSTTFDKRTFTTYIR